MKPIHRDDVPMEVMEEFEKFVQENYPGFKVQCVGDHQGLPPEVQASIDALEAKFKESLVNGACIDCGPQHEVQF